MSRPEWRTHAPGGATTWIISALVAIAMIAAVVFLGASVSTSPTPVDETQVHAELETLQHQLKAAITHRRDVAPIITDARKLTATYPDLAPARVTLAQALMMDRQKHEAYDQLVEALRLDPKQPEAEVLAGTLAMELDRYDDAERHYTRAIQLDPGNGKYRLHLAQALLKQNRSDDAHRTLLEALKVDSSLHAAHGMLSDVYGKQNQLWSAIHHIRQARELTPADKPKVTLTYTRHYASLLRRAVQPGEALLLLRGLPIEKHFDPGVMADLAACWEMLGQPQLAAQHYELALHKLPTYEDAAERAAQWYLKAKDLPAARRMIEQLRRINPRSPRLEALEKQLDQRSE